MSASRTVVIGFLGSQLDAGGGAGRWEKWRPTVALVQHPDVVIDRVELLHAPQHLSLAQRVREDMAAVSPETTVNLVAMALKNPWDFEEVYGKLYDWASRYPFDTSQETYWTHITTGTHVAQICLFLLVESRRMPSVLAQTSPPKRQIAHDPGQLTLIDLDLARYAALAQRFEAEQQTGVDFLKNGIPTRNARFNVLIEEVERVALHSRAPILFTGPTGAGKSLLARRLYELKRSRHRVQGALVEVNCATLRGDAAASTLFGHKKGAFTGASTDRAGLLRAADGGVLFLDEIGELGLDEQAMLLKAIEEKHFYPLGSDREVGSDFELIAATHRDLRVDVAQGRFREDLYARINLWTYPLPGLAQRREDIEPNVDHLLEQLAADLGATVRFHTEARRAYLHFALSPEAVWRGNFRDLAASLTRLVTLAERGRIGLPLVEAEIARLRWQWSSDAPQSLPLSTLPSQQTTPTIPTDDPAALQAWLQAQGQPEVDLFDLLQLQAVLQVCQSANTLSDAGRRLFAVSRQQRSMVNDADRLRKFLARFGLDWGRVRGG